jgi:tetratricopeptide (TPR) repeat protein
MALFDRTWRRAGRWGITLLPPGSLPAGDRVLNYLQGAYALEQVGRLAAARRAYRSGIRRWPQSHALRLAAANLAYRQRDYEEAEQTLRQALQHHPQGAVLWNNLAYVLAARGCVGAALSAVECAVGLAPGEQGYRESRQEIAAMSAKKGAQCLPIRCPLP